MKIKITENEKKRILNLHKNFQDNTQGIITEAIDSGTMKKITQCGTQTGVNSLADITKIPIQCTQYMIALALRDKSQSKHMMGCMTASKDVLLGSDTDAATKLLKLLADKAIGFHACLDEKGVDVAQIISDEITI